MAVKQRVVLFLTPEVNARLEAQAAAHGVSVSAAGAILIAAGLNAAQPPSLEELVTP
jgi:plasmid stability protein